jgi:hypothetical protein
MTLRTIILLLGLIFLMGGFAGHAQSVPGEYSGAVVIGDTRIIPTELTQSLDLVLQIRQDEKTLDYNGTLSFRRLFRDANGRPPLADVQGPLESLVINPSDWTFVATSAPIRFSLCVRYAADPRAQCVETRVIERKVTIIGTFTFDEANPCVPSVNDGVYSEDITGLAFNTLTLTGRVSLARTKQSQADIACLSQMNRKGKKAKGKS